MRDSGWSIDRTNGSAALPLYTIFALTGVGTALLGATLPVMLVHWRLTDAHAGLLFLVLFVASSSGSLVKRQNTVPVVAGATALLAVCCCALALTQGRAVFVEAALYGFGLGFLISTVTRVRLLFATWERVREVNRLNFVWGLGAFFCPTMANWILRRGSVSALFFSLAAVLFSAAIWAVLPGGWRSGALTAEEPDIGSAGAKLPWLAAAGAFLAVGLETAVGAWLATYAHRLEEGFRAPVEAITLFWLGLLASRAFCSTGAVRRVTERQLLLVCMGVAAAGCAALVGLPRREFLPVAALLIGLGVGPVFPMLLAAVLPRVRGNVIFVLGGLGASVLPWLTGVVSGRAGSLRVGLGVPLLAGVALLAMTPRLANRLEELARAGQGDGVAGQGDRVAEPVMKA